MNESAREVGVREYLSVLRRRWRWVALTPLTVLFVVIGLTSSQQRVYEAETEVLVLTDANKALFPVTATTGDRLTRNPFAERQYLSSGAFQATVGSDPTGLPSVSYELAPTDPDQDLVDAGILLFRARAHTAAGAAAAANDQAEAYVVTRHQQDVTQTNDQLADLEVRLTQLQDRRAAADAQLAVLRTQLQNSISEAEQAQLQADIALLEEERNVVDLAGQVRDMTGEMAALEQVSHELDDTTVAARVHNPAVAPTAPASPDVRRNILIAAIAGLVLGVAAAIARDLLDDTAFDPIALAQSTGIPVLGAIGALPEVRSDLASLGHGSGYQTVLNSLWLSSRSSIPRTIAVTSATSSVGKTKTAINLAQAEVWAGSTVLIIDANPISPMVISRLNPIAKLQMDVDADLADQRAAIVEPIGSGVPGIDLIDLFPSGVISSVLVGTAKLERLIEKFKDRYDLIVIDTHAVLSSVDVRPLMTQADAVIVVYEPRVSRVPDLERTIELLRGASIRVAGLVANRAPVAAPGYQYNRLSISPGSLPAPIPAHRVGPTRRSV